jgi:hypothetical protein
MMSRTDRFRLPFPVPSRHGLSVVALLALTCTSLPSLATPVKIHPPLAQFPSDKLTTLAPLLRTADFAVLESDARGWEKQVTTILYAKASPEAVREVVIHPERYQDFVRNMTGRSVSKNADGTFDHNWKLSYTVAGFSGVNRYTELPAAEGESAGEVEITDPTGMSHYRWQFLPASNGGGTIVVVYGYTDMRHSGGFIDKVLARAETLEHGLAIITQLTLHRAMVAQAEKHPGTFPPYVPPATGSPATSFRFLLDRGLLAVLHYQNGRLLEFSLTDRVHAPAAAVLDELSHAERWKYVPSYSKVAQHEAKDGIPVVEIEQSLPLMSWNTRFGVRPDKGVVDLFGLDGDLRGGHIRFDVRPDSADHQTQQIILRGQLSYDHSSFVMRELFKVEPLFEAGVNIGLTFVLLRAVKNEVERKYAPKVQ